MPKYLDGEGLSYFWGKIKSLFTNVVYHESDDGTSGEASIPSSDANIIEIVKVNGNPLTPDANKAVDIQVPTSLSQLSPDSTHRVVTDTEKTTWNNKGTYTKPSGGIPATDLEDGVIPIVPTNVSAFTNDAGYLTQHQSLTNYVQKSQTAGLIKNDGTVDTTQYGTYSKPSNGIPASDLENGVIPDVSGKADKTLVASSMPSGGFLPNVVYNLGTLSGDTTFLMAAATDNTIVNIWCWTFSTGATSPTISWPSGITKWSGSNLPLIDANKTYEITVMNGLATIIES